MKSRTLLAVEALESRWCPALTAGLSHGVLTISGVADNGSISVVQDATTAGKISVSDGVTALTGSPFTGVTSIKLNLTSADDDVTIDLGGQTLAGSVTGNLGGGADTLTVLNGTINGTVSVNSAASVQFGPGGGCGGGHGFGFGFGFFGFGFHRPAFHGGATADTLADTITIDATATIGGANIVLGQGGGTVTIDGDVTGNVTIDGSSRAASSNATTADVNGTVDGHLRFSGGSLADTLNVAGNIGGSVTANTGAGADTVTVDGVVTGGLRLETGSGDDDITLSNTVGGRVAIDAGAGNDALTVASTAEFLRSAAINMGAGADAVTFDATQITTVLLNGGSGLDVFTGNTAQAGLRLVSF